MEELILDNGWQVREEPLSSGKEDLTKIQEKDKGWIKASVPGDIHIDLIREGIISEPLIGLNSFNSEWIEDRSWWYCRKVETRKDWLKADKVELKMTGLDAMADIFVNGKYLGQHLSTFRPFIYDIKDLLKENGKKNVIVVRLTSGLEYFSEDDISKVAPFVNEEKGSRGDKRRVYVRKPQYTFGWDWNPRVPTCGITGEVKISPVQAGVIRNIRVNTDLQEENQKAFLNFKVILENTDWIGTAEGKLKIQIKDEEGNLKEVQKEIFLHSGYNFLELETVLDQPRLWWPHNLGEQHRYQIKAEAEIAGEKISYPKFKYGVRTVGLDLSKINEEERLFTFIINEVKTYARGANWIPPDSIYARVSEEKYETLIKEARKANFNMLRIWGGGRYEKDCFYEYCEQEGILVWQDFMFACGAYPDHEDWFKEEVRKEIDYQTKRLQNRSCIVLWCGNNENVWGFEDWWQRRTRGGAEIYHEIIPEIIEKNIPYGLYWNGSPYGGKKPNSPRIGNRHHWHDCMMNEDVEKRITPQEYDKVDPKFVTEYGYIGPPIKDSILKYLDGEPFDREGEAWQHHNNTFEKETVIAGIAKHYKSTENLSPEEYLLLAGLCQGMMYEYSLDSFRFKQNCGGALFWMYNDCWGEVGWTIIDYYLARKPSYYFVRRANAPVRIILRNTKEEKEIKVMVANNSPQEIDELLEFGYTSFTASNMEISQKEVKVPPFSREIVASFPGFEFNLLQGCIFASFPENREINPGIFKKGEVRRLRLPEPELKIEEVQSFASQVTFKITTNNFAHAVHFDLEGDHSFSDQYFDLLPGSSRKITVKEENIVGKDISDVKVKNICDYL